MGCVLTKDAASIANSEITKVAKTWDKQEQQTRKLLLLGSGSSGKSTIFKQLKCIHGTGIDPGERDESIHVIRQNCIAGILTILRKAHDLYDTNPEEYNKCKIDMEDEEIANAIQKILQYSGDQFSEDDLDSKEMESLGECIYNLWMLEGSQATYDARGDKFSFPENMDYFFNKAKEIMKKDYIPSEEDVFKTRIRTTGMIENKFLINNEIFHVYDVGGQRNERKKWIHLFQDVTAVIFVAALNHYNALLFEDEKKNALHESVELFEELCNSKWFRKTEMILFLNKNDLFREQLKSEIPLSICFGKGTGWKEEGPHWTGTDYHKKENETDDVEYFEFCYNQAVQFIQDVYVTGKGKHIYAHVTCATSRDNISKVFWDVQNMIVRANLNRGGLLVV